MSDFIKYIIERISNCKCLKEQELRAILDSCMKKGFEKGYAQCKKDYDIDQNDKFDSNRRISNHPSKIEIAILFIKADRGLSVINNLKSSMHVSPNLAEKMYDSTLKLWIGTKESYDNSDINRIFFEVGTQSNIGPEYDTIAVLIKLNSPVSCALNDSFQRHEFINYLCNNNCTCEKLSERLPLDVINKYKLLDV